MNEVLELTARLRNDLEGPLAKLRVVAIDAAAKMQTAMDNTREATEQAGKAAKQSEGMFKEMGKAVAAAFAVGAVVQFGKEAAQLAIDAEQTGVAFETMLGSKAAADKLLGEIAEFATKTPFEKLEVINASRQLLAFGVTADDTIGTLKTLGDIASGTGAPIGDLAFIFGKVKAATKLTGEAMQQLQEKGIPITDLLAKKFGVPASAVAKMVSDSKVSFADFNDAMASMTTEGGRFFNLMEKQSVTTGGKLSNLADQASAAMLLIGQSLQPVINQLVDLSAGALTSVVAWFKEATTEGSSLNETLRTVGVVVGTLAAAFAGYQAVLLVTSGVAGIMAAAQAALNAVMLLNPIGLVVAAVAALVAGFYLLYQRSSVFRATLAGIWEVAKDVGTRLMNLFMGLKDVYVGAFTLDTAQIEAGVKKIAGAFENLKGIGDSFNKGYAASLSETAAAAKANASAAAANASAKPGATTAPTAPSAVSMAGATKATNINVRVDNVMRVDTVKVSSTEQGRETMEWIEGAASSLLQLVNGVNQVANG
jgi:tape measure domain-containing protein